MIVLGIDGGLTGAMAILGEKSAHVLDLPTVDLPGNGTVRRRVHGPALAALVRQHCPAGEPILAVVEDLSVGGRDSSAQTVGSQYRTRGTIECCLEMLGLEPHAVNARTWKRFFGLRSDKGEGLQLARQLYPECGERLRLVADHNRGEALLIARWGKRNLT